MKFSLIPTPPELFRQFERGELSREELQATMAVHARELIVEMEDAHRNPKRSYFERLRNLAAMRRLAKKHSPALMREVLSTLGRIEGFPPAQILWNASHQDVPLHCFLRMRQEPVFRIRQLVVAPMEIEMIVEYGAHRADLTTREHIVLQRDALMRLELKSRESAPRKK